MDASILPSTRPDVVSVTSEPRPTAKPGQPFSEVLKRGANGIVQGAEAAMSVLPGGPILAAAVRGGSAQPTGLNVALGSGAATMIPEGPSATAASASGLGSGASLPGTDSSGVEASLVQSEQMNLYFLQVQEQVDAQNRTFTTLSNVLKTENDTMKNAIGNLR
jgi:hypothetical protein